MDQFNLFEDTPAAADCTPTTSVGHTAQKDTPIGQNPNGIFAFALKEARRMWDGVEHRRRSLEQLESGFVVIRTMTSWTSAKSRLRRGARIYRPHRAADDHHAERWQAEKAERCE